MFLFFVFVLFAKNVFGNLVIHSDEFDKRTPIDFSPINFTLSEGTAEKILSKDLNTCNIEYNRMNYIYGNFFNKTLEEKGSPCEEMTHIIHDYFECFPVDWKIVGFLGSGVSGKVFSTMGPNGEYGALKMLNRYEPFEVQMNELFHYIGLAQEVKQHCTYNNDIYIIHTGRIHSTLKNYFIEDLSNDNVKELTGAIAKSVQRMEEVGFVHGDFHSGNIGFTINDDGITATFRVIDFSYSKYGANPAKDLLQIFLRNPYSDEMRNEIRKVFGYIYPKNDDDLKLVKKYGFQLPMPYRVASEKLGISVCEDYVKNHHTDIVCTQK